jgi:ATP-dependent RNA helicase DDX24/MAK5
LIKIYQIWRVFFLLKVKNKKFNTIELDPSQFKVYSTGNKILNDGGDVDEAEFQDFLEEPKKKKKKKNPKEKSQGIEKIEKVEIEPVEVIDMSKWNNMKIPDQILKNIEKLKFSKPTPVQENSIPKAMESDSDILIAAETGSGKTLSFGIPIVSKLMNLKKKKKSLKGLILTPTRELAMVIGFF